MQSASLTSATPPPPPPSKDEGELLAAAAGLPQPLPPIRVKHTMIYELRKQMPVTLPLSAMNLTWFAKIVITTGFLGRLGGLELAGGSLGLTITNVTGFSVLMGLSAAMEPMCGQAFGAKNYRLMHRSLLMTTIMLLFASVPIAFLWLKLDKVLSCFGQQRDIVALAKIYVTWLLPDLAVTSFLSPLKAYLSSQGVAMPIFVSSAVALALHVPTNVVLAKWSMGLRGVAMATCTADLVVLVMLAAYVAWTERRRNWDAAGSMPMLCGWGWWCEQRASDWSRLLRLAGPCCLTTCLEWWCYEILVLLAGRLPDAKRVLDVLAIVFTFDYLLYSVTLSLSTCTSMRVSNELGAGNPSAARVSGNVSLGVGFAYGCVGGLAMAAAGGRWGRLFSQDADVLRGVRKMMPLMAAVEVVNIPLTVCGGIARGTARPQLGMYATLGGFYFVALPLGAALAFKRRLGLVGLLLGFLAGAATSLAVLLVLIKRIRWVGECHKAQVLASNGKEEEEGDNEGEGEGERKEEI